MSSGEQAGGWIAVIVACVFAIEVCGAQETDAAAKPAPAPVLVRPSRCGVGTSYEEFVGQHREHPPTRMFGTEAPVELSMTAVLGEEKPVDARAAAAQGECYQVAAEGMEIARDGTVHSFLDDSDAMRGGGGGKLPSRDLARLESLMDRLPPDDGRMPAQGHKLIVQVVRSGATTVRVYDRARLPDEVLEMIRLTEARVEVLSPILEPEKKWPADEMQSSGFIRPMTRRAAADAAQLPQNLKQYLPSEDWQMGVAISNSGEASTWDEEAHRTLATLDGLSDVNAIAFSPDGRQVAVYSGPDNVRKLILTVWDVRTGKMVRELWPTPWASHVQGEPLWWNNGKWILAPYWGLSGEGGEGIWHAETGRFLGTIAAQECRSRIQFKIVDGKLLQGCPVKDEVWQWSIDGVKRQTEAFAAGR